MVGTGISNTSASVSGNRNYATATASTASTAVATSRQPTDKFTAPGGRKQPAQPSSPPGTTPGAA